MDMGRKSMADQLIDEFRDEPEGPGLYVLAYDFGSRISNRFWSNLNIVLKRGGGGHAFQRSIVLVTSEKATRIIAKLVKHYGGEAAAFKIEKELDL